MFDKNCRGNKLNFAFVLLAAASLCLTENEAIAQSSSNQTSSTSVDTMENLGAQVTKGVGVNIGYSLAQDWDLKINGIGGSAAVKIKSSGAPGIGIRYSDIKVRSFGYTLGSVIHIDRRFDSAEFSGRSEQLPESKLTMITVEPNATFGLSSSLYLFGGPNYLIPVGKTGVFESLTIEGDLGVQAGLGFADGPLIAELQYQTLNPRLKVGPIAFDESRIWGFGLRVGYTF
ncbi:MAG: hypothetical protein COT74_02470 [Bdellovibrionales bacterium CG10_big_fil_rev_8_21_14_0_10_45_34]|nr:MAG: hypothetical protein COT74_02470 [Bdellovibrionales bacterium CG10_big_fil_rev_8_21_14_0_10_45_34]